MTPRQLERILRRALSRMDLRARVMDALSAKPRRRVSVVAIGKAAPAMASGALACWSDFIDDVLVVTSDGTSTTTDLDRDRRVEILRSAHPIPDKRSIKAAKRCIKVAECTHREGDSTKQRMLLVLVSGGASALVCSPAKGIRLADKVAVTRSMLTSGASIHEINVVRKHLSSIKGGGLARAAAPASVMTLAASDVIGGAISDIGSGPSVADRSTVTEARALLRHYAPRFVDLPLVRNSYAVANADREKIIASPEELARVVTDELTARLLPPSQASVTDLAREYLALAATLRPGQAIVRVAEPSLRVVNNPKAKGRGGRSTHLAAMVGRDLPKGIMFAAVATDGVDGVSGTGGAIVDHRFANGAGRIAIDDALARFDTGTLHRVANTAIREEPSGQNFADVHVLMHA